MKKIDKTKIKLFNFFYRDFFFKKKINAFKIVKLENDFINFLNNLLVIKKAFLLLSKYKKINQVFYIETTKKKLIVKNDFLLKEKSYAKNYEELLKSIPQNFNYLIKPIIYKKKYIQRYKNNLFCIYPFYNGKYFDGSKKNAKVVAKAIVKIFNFLSEIKIKNRFKSFRYYKSNDEKIFRYYLGNDKKLKFIFKKKIYLILKNDLKLIFKLWNYNKKLNFKNFHGVKTLCHWDIHPHNILVNKNSCKILDYSRLKYMPVGYTLSYSFFKIGKQIILKNKNKIEAFKILNILKFYYVHLFKKFRVNINYLYDLTTIEIIRRIIIILKILKKDPTDPIQYILPTLVKNFRESKYFFKIVG